MVLPRPHRVSNPRREKNTKESTSNMPTWLITGCSTGLGRHLAQAVLDTAGTRSSPLGIPQQSGTSRIPIRTPARSRAGCTDRTQVAEAVRQAEARGGGVRRRADRTTQRRISDRHAAVGRSSTSPRSPAASHRRAPVTTPPQNLPWRGCRTPSARRSAPSASRSS